jgi:hypothetical protein
MLAKRRMHPVEGAGAGLPANPISQGRKKGYMHVHVLAQDARVRGNTHDEVPMEPTMYGRLATAMTTTVSRIPSAPDKDEGDNEPMW